MATRTLTEETFDDAIRSAEKPVLVDFWASWCGPCRALAPVVEEISNEMADELTVYKCNVENDQDLAMRFLAMPSPCPRINALDYTWRPRQSPEYAISPRMSFGTNAREKCLLASGAMSQFSFSARWAGITVLCRMRYRPRARLSWTTRRRETEIFLPSTPWMPSCITPLETTSTSSTYCRFTM